MCYKEIESLSLVNNTDQRGPSRYRKCSTVSEFIDFTI